MMFGDLFAKFSAFVGSRFAQSGSVSLKLVRSHKETLVSSIFFFSILRNDSRVPEKKQPARKDKNSVQRVRCDKVAFKYFEALPSEVRRGTCKFLITIAIREPLRGSLQVHWKRSSERPGKFQVTRV